MVVLRWAVVLAFASVLFAPTHAGTRKSVAGTLPAKIATATRVIPISPVAVAPLAAWTKVAVCEEGGWVGRSGPEYPDSLGITARNWKLYGGGGDYSPLAQIAVAERLMASAGAPGQIPDQHGCAPW